MTDPQPITATVPAWPHPLTVTLPLPPPANNMYANAAKGRVLSEEARAWKRGTEAYAGAIFRQQGLVINPPLSLTLFVYFANNRRDLDGVIKITQDAVCDALGVNDRHVHALHCYRRIDRANPRLVVVVGEAREG